MVHRIENPLQIAMKKPDANCIKIGVRLMAEKVGFEPTDGFTRQTISSRSRYDHFDTSPYV